MILTMNVTQETKITVVGVSQDPSKYGFKIFTDLVKANYNVVGVNPKGGMVADKLLITSLREVNPKPELVITVVPPKITESVVQECINLGIKQIWMQPGSESVKAIKLAEDNGLEVISQACFMVKKELWQDKSSKK